MKILIIGANGTIGSMITKKLRLQHEVVTAGRSAGDLRVDLSSAASITRMFGKLKQIDACVCVAGESYSGSLSSINQGNLDLGISNKLLGQINLVLIGQYYLTDAGSFTLISGKMGDKPVKNSVGKAIVNGGINSFVLAASLEMPRQLRINVISPAKVSDIPEQELIAAYLKSIEGTINGEIIRVNYN